MQEIIAEAAANHFWRVVNLTERVFLGPLTPSLRTPSRAVFMWEHTTLYHYTPLREVSGPPILIIPPLMVRPMIFDLRAGHSFIHFLMEQGNDVYLLDLGVPDKNYQEISLEDYILNLVGPAVEKVLEISGEPKLFLYGWSMGGIMCYLHACLAEDQSHLAGLIACGSPVDFTKMFPFHILAKIFNLPLVGFVNVVGNVPPIFFRIGFKALSPLSWALRHGELIANYHDREWVAAYESIDAWVDDFIPYAKETFKQFVGDLVIEDKLRTGKLEIGDRVADLRNIECPTLIVSGKTDKLAPADSVEPAAELIGSKDFTMLQVNMGHIGMVAGRSAPDDVWAPIADWIADRK